ncbi:MAG: DUF305 domain-containing protein [Rickettsiales bacterium]|nr:DUF305 domain-containing protein [Rickettsiales bacterium]
MPLDGQNEEGGVIMKNLINTTALVAILAFSPIMVSVAFAHESNKGMMQSSPNATKAPYDIQFVDTMAEHHREGIKMFQMAVDKAESQELKNKAQEMVDDQTKEIAELKSLHTDVKPNAPEAINMKLPGMMAMDMSKLESAKGKDFDHHFIDMAVKHHQAGVNMSRDALKHAKNQQVKDKAQMIIDQQTQEIAEMKEMRDSMK